MQGYEGEGRGRPRDYRGCQPRGVRDMRGADLAPGAGSGSAGLGRREGDHPIQGDVLKAEGYWCRSCYDGGGAFGPFVLQINNPMSLESQLCFTIFFIVYLL